jgi:hypothetical protein
VTETPPPTRDPDRLAGSTQTVENVTWARGYFGAMRPHSTGIYVINLGAEGTDSVSAVYVPRTYDRLVRL